MPNKPFYGREQELEKLNHLLRTSKADLVVVKGRRRIGKSRLVKEFATQAKKQGYASVYLSGIAPGSQTKAEEMEDFAQQLSNEFNIPPPRADNWNQLLWALADRVKGGHCVVILDEINWLGGKDPTFLGKLKNAWDQHFSETPNLILILSGSLTGWIEKNILRNTGFLGRITMDLTLQELPLQSCNFFWGKRKSRISAYEKLQILSVTGGIPRYLEEIDPSLSTQENVRRLCFEADSLLYREFDNLFADLFSRRQTSYREIVTAVCEKPLDLNELYQKLGRNKSGYISEYVDDLEKNGFLSRDYTWSLSSGKQSKLSKLRIQDNYLRFFLKHILQNQHKIERGGMKKLPNQDGILGLQFENLVLKNRHVIWQYLNLSVDQIVFDNPFFQRKNQKQRGCQIDYMIQSDSNTLYVCEIKCQKNKIGTGVIEEVQNKINTISRPLSFNIRPVLIHVNGVSAALKESDYFDEVIDFGAFFSF